MAKAKDRTRVDSLYEAVLKLSALSKEKNGDVDAAPMNAAGLQATNDVSKTPRMKKFRFQLLHQWLVANFAACRTADIGGGKGLLTYLLRNDGWDATVIDPERQALLHKYKSLETDRQTAVPSGSNVPRINAPFEIEMAREFDLLISLHAHACNVKIIDAATTYGSGFLLLPCCIMDEPLYPIKGISWMECLTDYAIQRGHVIYPLQLNFKGQNIGFYSFGQRVQPRIHSPLPEVPNLREGLSTDERRD